MTRRADVLRALAEEEMGRAHEAIRAGDPFAAERALHRAQTLRRIAYMRAAAATYQGNPALNPHEHGSDRDAIDGVAISISAPDRDLFPEHQEAPERVP